MSVQLLATKFHVPPIRPEYVSRPRLIQELNEGQHRKVTLLSAPAGFGKTSIVSEWMTANDRQSCWLSLDSSDNDPARFLSYLIGALQTARAEIGDEALSLVESSQQLSAETALTSLINEIVAESMSVTLMLDDYHLIENHEIDRALDFLIEHLPPQMHLVISTREDPQLAMARLRASGQLNEIRAVDLRFLAPEVAEFLNEGMALGLGSEDVASLEQRTEGWIASLQLAALSIQKQSDVTGFIRSFTGSHRLVLDYLVEEVLGQQTDEVQDFLIQTSILDRMCGSLCDELTGRRDGQRILEVLDKNNLFIVPLDNERRWYRYHHLFAQLLRQRLDETQPQRVPEFHALAGEWCLQNGLDLEAIDHAVRAQDFEHAAGWIERYLGDNFELIGQSTRERWLGAFPEEFQTAMPHLVLLEAWTMLVGGRLEEAERCLNSVEAARTSSRFFARVAVIRTLIAEHRGIPSQTIRYGRQSLDCLPEEESSWRCIVLVTLADAYAAEGQMEEARRARAESLSAGQETNDVILIMTANLRNAEALRRQGKLSEVIAICRRMLREAETRGIAGTAATGWLLGIYGETLAETNNLDLALQHAQEAANRAEQSDDIYFIGSSKLYLIRVLFSCGDLAGAREAIESLELRDHPGDMPLSSRLNFSAWKARVQLAEGQLEAAGRWAAEHGFDADMEPNPLREMEYHVLARVLIAQGRAHEAVKLLRWAHKLAETGERVATIIESLSLRALACHAAGDIDEALALLNRSLSLAEPEGFVRVFVDEGPPMASLLYEAATRGEHSQYVRRLLSEFPAMESDESNTTTPTHPDLLERLSEREIDVIRLMAEGLSNEQIGERLFISMHTVKVHARNIYAKLDTHNRTEAVARARYYGILTDSRPNPA